MVVDYRILKRPYIYWVVGVFFSYILVNILISGFYEKVPLFLKYASSVNWTRLTISIVFAITIALLVSISSVLTYIKIKERQNCKKQVAVTSIGTVGGIVTGFCPLCVTGLVPLIFSAVGITFTFSSLPFSGLEVQAVIILLLAINLYYLNRKR